MDLLANQYKWYNFFCCSRVIVGDESDAHARRDAFLAQNLPGFVDGL